MIKDELKEVLKKFGGKKIYKPLIKVDRDLVKILMKRLNIIIKKIPSKKKKLKKKSFIKKRFREISSFLNLTTKKQNYSRSELGSFISLSKKKIILKRSFLKKKKINEKKNKKSNYLNEYKFEKIKKKNFNNSEIISLNKSRSLKKNLKAINKRKRKIKINSTKTNINLDKEKNIEDSEKFYYKKNDNFENEYLNTKNSEISNSNLNFEKEIKNKKISPSKKENTIISSNNLEIIPKFLNKMNSLNSFPKICEKISLEKSPKFNKTKFRSKNKKKNTNNISLRNRSIYFNTVDKYSISKKFFQKFKVNKNFSDSLKKFKPKSLFRNKTSLASNLKYKFLNKKF